MGISLFWNIIFVASVSQGFFLAVVLLIQFFRTKYWSQLFLGIFILAFTYNLTNNLVYWNELHGQFPHFMYSTISERFLFAPLFFLYCMYFIQKKLKISHGLHFLPFIILTLIYLPFLVKSGADKISIAQGNFFEFGQWRLNVLAMVNWLLSFQLVIYPLIIFKMLRIYVRKNVDSITDSNLNQINWLRFFNSLFLLYGLMMLFYVVLVDANIGGIWKDYPISLVMCIAVYAISYFSITNPDLLKGEKFLERIKVLKYHKTRLSEAYLSTTILNFERVVKTEMLFLDADLKIINVAEILQIPKHHISQALSLTLGKSFNEYLNELRVIHAQHLLDQIAEHDSIKTIMYSSGFNNRASFNNNFKKYIGLTASDYIKNKQVS